MTPAEFRQLNEAAHMVGMEVIHKDGLYRLVDVNRHDPYIVTADPFAVAVRVGEIKASDPDRIPY